jgi:hypothetical protein
MAFPLYPSTTKSQIRAAGDLLAYPPEDVKIGNSENARVLLAQWRACHLLPLHALATDLQERLVRLGINATVALRLKRLFRIVEKLSQTQSMNATTMQDIAGLRAIAPSVQDVNRIVHDYVTHPSPIADTPQIRDYIATPKDGGYRSMHMVFRYRGPVPSEYDGLRIELQVRTDVQHLWASAVEVTGMWTGQRVKYDEGDPAWTEFFALIAEMIARREGTPSSAGYQDVCTENIRNQLRMAEQEINARNTIRARVGAVLNDDFQERLEAHPLGLGGILLLILDSRQNQLTIQSYGVDCQEQALIEYANEEQRITFDDSALAPVLVSVNSTERLRDAYRSFFQDITPFCTLLDEFLGEPPS